MKKVYTCFCTDVIHDGHLNLINHALEYGEVTVGVLSEKAMIRYDRFPTISEEERVEMIRKIPGVRIRLTGDAVKFAMSNRMHSGQKVKKNRDGSFLFSIPEVPAEVVVP